MAVVGPSPFIDLTLDSENRFIDISKSDGDSYFIDLTLDSEDDLLKPKKNVASSDPEGSVVFLDDEDEIQISTPFRGNRRMSTRTKRQKVLEVSDDEVSVSTPVASSSKITLENRRKTRSFAKAEELVGRESDEEAPTQRLAQQYNKKDEILARKLAREEEKSYKKLVQSIEKKKEGIVFSVVINAENNTLEDGSPAHPDDLARFEPWKKLCEQPGTAKVKKFHWFVNYELEKRFELARAKLEGIMGERPPEVQLFHGTAPANVDSILKGGLKIGGFGGHPVSHGSSMGFGIYLGTAASTSLGYAVGSNKIFACRVVPGRVTNMPIHRPPPSSEVGSENFECYGGPGMGVYVHRYASLVLPCYMIEFDLPQYTWGFMGIGAGMALPAPVIPPIPVVVPPAPKPRARRAPRNAKAPTTEVAPNTRKRTRKAVAEAEAAAATPRKRQRRMLLAEDDEDTAPLPTSSREGKGKARA